MTSMGYDIAEIRDGEPGGQWRYDEPGKYTADYPEAFPCPAFYLFIGDVETAGSKAAEKMVYHPE